MAEDNQSDRSSDDLTEETSPHRLEEYRRKGMVSQSKEVSGIAALLAAGVTCYAMSPKIGADVSEFMREVFRTDLSARADLGNLKIVEAHFGRTLHLLGALGLPICCAGFLAGIIASYAQIGSIFSWDPIQPDMTKVDPISGIKRMFSGRQLVDGVKVTFKVIIVVAIIYGLMKAEIIRAPGFLSSEPGVILEAYGSSAKSMFLALVSILSVFAAIDFILQRRDYNKQLRMTKQEAKQEFKEREGDPQIKMRIRTVQREMARKRMMQAVKKADVIVTNPTHIAVAIVYDRKKMAAPKVVAKGADLVAQRIKQIAAEAGVPLVENVPLARTLYKSVKIGQYVPRALYQAIAEVLAYVYRLRGRGF